MAHMLQEKARFAFLGGPRQIFTADTVTGSGEIDY